MFDQTFYQSFETEPHVAAGNNPGLLLGTIPPDETPFPGITQLLAGGMIHALSPMSYHFKSLPCFILLYTMDGRGKISDSSGTTFLNAGTLLFHDCRTSFKLNISTSVWNFCILFIHGDNISSYYSFLEKENFPKLSKLSKASAIPSYLEKICALAAPSSLSNTMYAHKWVTDILTELCIPLLHREKQEEKIPDYLKAMKKMLDEMYAESISLADLEEQFGINRYRLCREFSYHYRIPPIQYLNKRRIEAAKELLLTTRMPVHEVGSLVGIDNTNHFINLFKKNTGTTPFAFKQAVPASIRALRSPYTPDAPQQ